MRYSRRYRLALGWESGGGADILAAMPGASVRTDIVDVYVFRLCGVGAGRDGVVEFLHLRRKTGKMSGTWQPVMGHVEEGETSVRTALRELAEETGYAPGKGLAAVWQLESVNGYFLAAEDCVMLCPCFAVQVQAGIDPVLDAAHDGFRWVRRDRVDREFVWPGQRAAIEQIVRDILPGLAGGEAESGVAKVLRIDLGGR